MRSKLLSSSNGSKQGIISFFAALVLFSNPCSSASASYISRASESVSGSPTSTPTGTVEPIDVNSYLPAARESARKVPSLFLSEQQKVETVEGFVKIIGIKSQSGEEAAVREELRQRLAALGLVEIKRDIDDPNAPMNLIMELPASKDFKDRPAIILNAHMDTITTGTRCTPEEMNFDATRREFFHRRELSFGADDKAGIIVVLSALKTAKALYWDKGTGHRRIIVIFTAQEERGAVGARYITKKNPEIFEDVEITLMNDGPLDYRKGEYPENSFVIVVDEQKSRVPPFSRIMSSIKDICNFKDVSYVTTRAGLGQGDIGGFPVNARTDLHIRAPHQGYHSRERVKLDDLFNHIDLFTYIVLSLDDVSLRFDKNKGRLYPSGAD
jgi:putative aminopeptidase FrvX